ncbi:MAG: hypothetical protein U1C74_33260 [Phenylobacterium sp.]|nr:hypothetical protein [Phenylobacterium sp.]
MGEQNRRAVDGEGAPGDVATPQPAGSDHQPTQPRDTDDERALGPEADERQTLRQAPTTATPGEGAEDDSIG